MFEASTPADRCRTVRAADSVGGVGFLPRCGLLRPAARNYFFPRYPMENKKKAPAKESKSPVAAEDRRVPINVFRIDDVSASVFSRTYNERTFYSVSFSRSYKSASGEWRYTKNFDREDLGKIVALCQQVSEYIDRLAGDGRAAQA